MYSKVYVVMISLGVFHLCSCCLSSSNSDRDREWRKKTKFTSQEHDQNIAGIDQLLNSFLQQVYKYGETQKDKDDKGIPKIPRVTTSTPGNKEITFPQHNVHLNKDFFDINKQITPVDININPTSVGSDINKFIPHIPTNKPAFNKDDVYNTVEPNIPEINPNINTENNPPITKSNPNPPQSEPASPPRGSLPHYPTQIGNPWTEAEIAEQRRRLREEEREKYRKAHIADKVRIAQLEKELARRKQQGWK